LAERLANSIPAVEEADLEAVDQVVRQHGAYSRSGCVEMLRDV
jgi:hypothetical protein